MPDCIVVYEWDSAVRRPNQPSSVTLKALENNRLGTREVFSVGGDTPDGLLFDPRRFFGESQVPYSNLAKVSPAIRIYSYADLCLPD